MSVHPWIDIESALFDEGKDGARPVLVWHVLQGVMITSAKKARRNPFHRYWQEIPTDWIDARIQPPTRRDADAQNCVIIKDEWGDFHTKGWRLVCEKPDGILWIPPPAPPDNYKQLRESAD